MSDVAKLLASIERMACRMRVVFVPDEEKIRVFKGAKLNEDE